MSTLPPLLSNAEVRDRTALLMDRHAEKVREGKKTNPDAWHLVEQLTHRIEELKAENSRLKADLAHANTEWAEWMHLAVVVDEAKAEKR